MKKVQDNDPIQEKKQSMETNSEIIQMLYLIDRDFIAAIISKVKEAIENMLIVMTKQEMSEDKKFFFSIEILKLKRTITQKQIQGLLKRISGSQRTK